MVIDKGWPGDISQCNTKPKFEPNTWMWNLKGQKQENED
uniref:Uncharacterized protein n=1 Tax=Arundo donax TaxID=35708 RepID=A0A0A9CII8_ARUDO